MVLLVVVLTVLELMMLGVVEVEVVSGKAQPPVLSRV